MQFAIVCFVLFFLLSQVFQWAQEITLPLPFFILAGALLAIASNFDRRAGLPFNLVNSPTPEAPPVEPPAISQSPAAKFPHEISFTIRKPEKLDQ